MTFYDRQILQKVLSQDTAIRSVCNLFLKQVSPLLSKYNYEATTVWAKNSAIERQIDSELERLKVNLESVISNNQKWAWAVSNKKNDALVSEYIKGLNISTIVKNGLYNQNAKALEAFINRKIDGFTVSDRVWDICRQTKTQLEFYLESGIGTGRSAVGISQDIRQLLNEPDKIFRRIRDAKGNLVASKPMKDYHPGQGVYRSSAKNALRLASNETNLAYRNADYMRWQQLDFVIGIDVKLSGSHPFPDICNHMVGRYPKDFKFTGWHTKCICFAIPVLMERDHFLDTLDLPEDEKTALINRLSVTNLPQNATTYIDANQVKLDQYKLYWVKDNFKSGKLANGLK